jgi:WD40 repeat protein
MNYKSTASMPKPLPPMRTDLAIWSLAPEKLIVAGKLQGKENAITTLRFSRDNRFLVTGHQGGTIRVWKLPRDAGGVPPRDGSAESSSPAP